MRPVGADAREACTCTNSGPADLDLQLVRDNCATHKTPEIPDGLPRRPVPQLHFTPTSSSWLVLVERWFADQDTWDCFRFLT